MGLLATGACSDRDRNGGRNGGATGHIDLNGEEDGTTGNPRVDGGVTSSGEPDITVTGDGDVGYTAYQRYLTAQDDIPGPVCDCAVAFGAYSSPSECLNEFQPATENACIAAFTRTYAEGAAMFFDCAIGAYQNFTTCLRSRSCYDQSDYDFCVGALDNDWASCDAALTEAEVNALSACNG